jgi:hypothetical protein
MKKQILKMKINLFIMAGLFLTGLQLLPAQDWQRVADLRGNWKFSIGDDAEWARYDYNDSEWDSIFVPAAWEDEGFPGYDGYAWYRKHFRLAPIDREKNLYVNLGFIDDVDEVYFNGHFIGFFGLFPPVYFTAYNFERIYRIPGEYLNLRSDNVLSVRVYDDQQAGGIIRGQIGIYTKKNDAKLQLSLEGPWKFALGDDMNRERIDYDDSNWKNVMVPAYWETQGYRNYDGFAWYRKEFFIPEKLRTERLVLLLGKIDDLDETYLNGKLIGRTGIMKNLSWLSPSDEWLELRAYELSLNDVQFGQMNVLAVRVFDGLVQGGIYEGPVGIASYQDYKTWLKESEKPKKSFIDRFFKKNNP